MYLQTKSFLLEFFTKSKSDRSKMQFLKMITIQESPPARNRTRHTARGVTCPGEGGSPILSWLGEERFPSSVLAWGGDTPVLSWQGAYSSPVLVRGYPRTASQDWVPHGQGWGTPLPAGTGVPYPPQKGPGTRDLRKNLGLGTPPLWWTD